VLLDVALAGSGIALQRTSLASGVLVAVLPEWQVPAMMVYALYPSRRHLPPAVRALLDFLVERFRSVPW
jgi:DNA-binding transcriptional LysR family regulator